MVLGYVICVKKEKNLASIFLLAARSLFQFGRELKLALKLSIGWNGNSVNECFQNWSLQNYTIKALPAHICWYIWKDRNKKIFEDRSPSVDRIVYLATGSVGSLHIKQPDSSKRLSPIFLPADKAHAWFDGASQHNGDLCGAGGVLKIGDLLEYRWTLNCVSGTNSRAELMGAWASIILAKRLGIHDLHVMGDSRL
jgi:hypothetical protein